MSNIMRINAPRRNHSASEARVNNGIDMDRLALRALAELIVDVMEERGAIPPRPTWEQQQ